MSQLLDPSMKPEILRLVKQHFVDYEPKSGWGDVEKVLKPEGRMPPFLSTSYAWSRRVSRFSACESCPSYMHQGLKPEGRMPPAI